MANLSDYLRMVRFSHTVFALPFAVLATFLAAHGGTGGFCGWGRLCLILVCMVAARNVAMTFNRIVDARIDARNPRTQNREIPAGTITRRQAWSYLLFNAVGFIATTGLFWLWFENPWPLRLAVPVLLFICAYSLTKRFTLVCHFWLGASLMLSPLSAWIAISPPDGPLIVPAVFYLGLAVLLWTAGFDIIYACQDIEVDRRDGLHSLPSRLGVPVALWISRISHSLCVTCLLMLAQTAQLGMIYLATVGVVALLLITEHILVAGGKMRHLSLAFATINGVISIILAVAGSLDIMLAR